MADVDDSAPMTAVELLQRFQYMVRKSDRWRGWVGDEPSDDQVIALLGEAIAAIEAIEAVRLRIDERLVAIHEQQRDMILAAIDAGLAAAGVSGPRATDAVRADAEWVETVWPLDHPGPPETKPVTVAPRTPAEFLSGSAWGVVDVGQEWAGAAAAPDAGSRYVVIVGHTDSIDGQWVTTYTSDLIQFTSRRQAIAHGALSGGDDFNIGTLCGGRLVAFGWGMADFTPEYGHDLSAIAKEIGLKP